MLVSKQSSYSWGAYKRLELTSQLRYTYSRNQALLQVAPNLYIWLLPIQKCRGQSLPFLPLLIICPIRCKGPLLHLLRKQKQIMHNLTPSKKEIWRRTDTCLQQINRVAYTYIATWHPCSLARSGISWLPSASVVLSENMLHGFGAGAVCERTSDTNIMSSATTSDMEGLEINSM